MPFAACAALIGHKRQTVSCLFVRRRLLRIHAVAELRQRSARRLAKTRFAFGIHRATFCATCPHECSIVNRGLWHWQGMEPASGIEPPTYGLRNRCSTTELRRHWRENVVMGDSASSWSHLIARNTRCQPSGAVHPWPRRSVIAAPRLPLVDATTEIHGGPGV